MKKNLKSLGIKSLATLLSVLMIFMMLPMTVFADILEGIQTADDPAFLRQSDIFEVKELRESHVKHFRLEDGSFIAAQYDVPVHYLDDNGEWQDIDNTLSESGNEYSTKNARIFFGRTSMTCRNLFRKKTVIPYREILSVDVDMDTVIKTPKKKITIYNYMRGRQGLMSAIKKYKESGDHTNDTVAPDKKVKAEDKSVRKFSESVNRLSTVLFSYVVCIVIAVGITVFLLYSLFTDSPLKQDEAYGLLVVVGFAVAAFLVGYVVLAVYAAKRAHRSKTLHAIAKMLIRNGYLKED